MTREIINFMDRYGHHIESDLTLERFAQLYDSVAETGPDEDWRNVAITDSDDWNVDFSLDVITFDNLEAEEPEGEIRRPVTRELALRVAEEFINADFTAIRARLTPLK